MKQIAHLIATNFYGGPERQIVNQTTLLNSSSKLFRSMIISFLENGKNELISKALEFGLPHSVIHAQGALNISAILELYSIIKENNIRLIVCHGYKANVIGRVVSFLVGIPIIAVSRGWTGENRKIIFYEKIDKFFLSMASHVVAVSEGQKIKIRKIIPKIENISVIRNSIHVDEERRLESTSIRQEFNIPETDYIVCTAGRLSPEKDQMTFLESARLVLQTRKDVHFFIFGEGVLRSNLEKKISDLKLSENFHLPGFRDNLLEIFRQMDIFVLPSLTEGLPNVVLEAFSCRKPVIATSVGGTPEIVQDGVSGILIAPKDVDALAKNICVLLENETERKAMGERGFFFVRDNFSYSSQVEAYLKLFNELTSNHA